MVDDRANIKDQWISNPKKIQEDIEAQKRLLVAKASALSTQPTASEIEQDRQAANAKVANQPTPVLSSKFKSNVLNSFQQQTYHFTLSMGAPSTWSITDSKKLLSGSSDITIIAETGVTGYNIKEVTLESFVGPSLRVGQTAVNKITIEMTEFAGITLFDRLYNVSSTYKIPNYPTAPYFLTIQFKGYTEAGEIDNSIGDLIYAWRIQIKDIKAEWREGTGYYSIEAFPYNDFGFSDGAAFLRDSFKDEVENAEEALTKFAQSLTDSEKDHALGRPANSYEIIIEKDLFDPPITAESLKIATTDDKESIKMGAYTTNSRNKATVHISSNTKVEKGIESMLAGTQYFQKEINKAKNNDSQGTTEKKSEDAIVSTLWKIIPEVKVLTDDPESYDVIRNDYSKKIIYHIVPYPTVRTMELPEKDNKPPNARLQDVDIQKSRINTLSKLHIMTRRYDYYYTGLNTEVLNLELKFNTLWAQLQNTYAATRTYEQSTQGPLYSEEKFLRSRAISNEVKLKQIEDNIRDLEAKYKISADSSSDNTALKADIANKKAERDKTKADIQAAKAQLNTVFDRNKLKIDAAYTGKRYIEDYNEIMQEFPPVPLSFAPDPVTGNEKIAHATENNSKRGRSLLTTALGNLGPGPDSDLMKITLEIRGDPYWLGRSAIEAFNSQNRFSPSSDTQANLDIGEHYFLLMFQFPTGVDVNGAPKLDRSQVISGVYAANKITHNWSNGIFKQTIEGIRDPGTNIANIPSELLK